MDDVQYHEEYFPKEDFESEASDTTSNHSSPWHRKREEVYNYTVPPINFVRSKLYVALCN